MMEDKTCVEIMQDFGRSIETLAISIAEVLLPAFQELNRAVLEWYQWYIQRRRKMMADQLAKRSVPVILANWIASWWLERWLPSLP